MSFYNWSQTAATDATADSAINWAEGQAPGSLNDSARAMMAVLAKYRDDVNGSLLTGGTSTAFTVTSNSAYDTLAHMDKQTLVITMNATSGATPTLNVDSLGAKPIRHATGATLPTGALLLGSVYRLTYYNTAGEFLISDQLAVQPTNSVATASIANSAVTYAKIQNEAATSLLGNPTGSPAAPAEITVTGPLAFSGTALTLGATTTAHGVALFEGTSAMGNTGTGTLGQVLVSGGASADPSFKSGAWVLLNTLTGNNSATTIGDNSSFGAYNDIIAVVENLLPQTNSVTLTLQVSSAATFQTSSYASSLLTSNSTAGSAAAVSVASGGTSMQLVTSANWGNSGTGVSGVIEFMNVANTSQPKMVNIRIGHNFGTTINALYGSGCWSGGNGAIDGFRLAASSGNIASGTIKIYGRL